MSTRRVLSVRARYRLGRERGRNRLAGPHIPQQRVEPAHPGADTLRTVSKDVKDAARSAERQPVFRALARGGYVASGIIHVIIGVLALSLAFTGSGETDQSSALDEVASAPLGGVLLWGLVVLLWALGAFHAVSGFTHRDGDAKKRWGKRLSSWGRAVAFIAIGGVTASVALGTSSDGDESAEDASRGLLDVPGGPILLALVGAGIIVAGIAFVVIGIRRGFKKKMTLPAGALGNAVVVLGLIGYIAKGVSIVIIGGLVGFAGIQNDPESAGTLDSAFKLLEDLPGGVVVTAAVGAGFIAYGVFCAFRARYAKLD